MSYTRTGFKFYEDAGFDYVYVRSKEQIYKYDILNDDTINRSSKLVDYPGNTIKDFGILKDSDKKNTTNGGGFKKMATLVLARAL